MTKKYQLATTINVNLTVTIQDDNQTQILIMNLTQALFFLWAMFRKVTGFWVTVSTLASDFKQAWGLSLADFETVHKLMIIILTSWAYGLGVRL